MVEAGCYQGGSSAKFGIVCEALGYRLHIYDSFEGVEPLTEEEKLHGHDFSGEYAVPEALVRSNIGQYGSGYALCGKGGFLKLWPQDPSRSPSGSFTLTATPVRASPRFFVAWLPRWWPTGLYSLRTIRLKEFVSFYSNRLPGRTSAGESL
jgi:hypothetical protein